MQYSPNNIVFTISLVDGGTIELLRGLGKNVVSSADLVAQFEATWSEEQIKTHFAARDSVDAIVAAAFKEIGQACPQRRNYRTRNPTVVHGSVSPRESAHRRSADRGRQRQRRKSALRAARRSSRSHSRGRSVLLDVWGKKNVPGAVYYDITWMGFVGKAPSGRMREVFEVVRDARDAGVKTVIGCGRRRAPHRRMGSRSRHPRPH